MARPGTENHGTEKYWHGTENLGTEKYWHGMARKIYQMDPFQTKLLMIFDDFDDF